MKACQGCRQSFIVTGQTTEARGPRETTLHHPAARQQNKALLSFGEFHHFQVNAVRRGILGRLGSGVALVPKGDFDGLAGDIVYLGRQLLDLGSVLCTRRGHMQCQQVAQRINGHMHLTPAFPFGPVMACAMATFGARL